MSRTLGDRDTSALGVIPDPTVVEIDLSTLQGPESFVVSVTDGLFDKVPLQDIADRLAHVPRGLFLLRDKSPDSLRRECESLVDTAFKEWNGKYTWGVGDDMSIAVHIL